MYNVASRTSLHINDFQVSTDELLRFYTTCMHDSTYKNILHVATCTFAVASTATYLAWVYSCVYMIVILI